MKKNYLFSLAFCAIAWMTGGSAWAQDAPEQDSDGYYLLGSVADVEWFGDQVLAGHHTIKGKLTADIDYENVENAHKPIGNDTHKFIGEFDGQGHRILNMILVNPTSAKGVGFFGSVRGGGDGIIMGSDSEKEVNLNVVIKNLIIDSSCSIQSNQTMTAGVVGRAANSSTGHLVTIENCINEANVTSTQKNVGGILGTVDGTNLNLIIKNCGNIGRIDGATTVEQKENAAICGWTGKNNNANVQLTGCWNIGEVVSIDGNGYNLFRVAGASVKMENNFDLNPHANAKQGLTTWTTDDPVKSGELCYRLNGDQSVIGWYQKLPNDDMPLPFTKDGAVVYQNATYLCPDKTSGDVEYSNENNSVIPDHNCVNGFCSVCNKLLTDYITADADGFLPLASVADVEWFSAMVAAGNLSINGKLMNDIDFDNVENAHNPIGPTTGQKYNGMFDGQGFRIKNMIINRPDQDNQGFFGFLRGNIQDTYVKNLIIDSSCSITGKKAVGGIAANGQNNETFIYIQNCVNEANITALEGDAGGILGSSTGNHPKWIIQNCVNTGTITAAEGSPYAGGLTGWMGDNGACRIENFINIGEITYMDNNQNIYRGNNIKASVLIDLSGTEGATQGIVEGMTPSDLATGKVTYYINNLVGSNVFFQNLETNVDLYPVPFRNGHGVVYIQAELRCDGTPVEGGEVTYSNSDTGAELPPHTLGTNGFCSVCHKNLVESLSKDDEGFYLISNAAELEFFSDMVEVGGQSADNKAKLTADIDMAGVTHKPIGGGANDSNKFNSTFDGQNHTISNMTSFTRTENVGLFSWVRGSSIIKNLTIDETCEITGTDHVAAFVGKIQAGDAVRFENCINRATVICSNNHAAAFVGKSFTGNLKTNMINCGNAGRIESGLNACALVSWNTGGTIKNCWNVGEIVKSDWDRANGADYDNTIMVSTLNLFNGNAANNVTLVNTFDASPSAERSQGTILDAAAATSGELAYKIGGDWKQFIKIDVHPVFDGPAVSYVGDAGYATLFDATTGYVLNGDVEANVAVLNNTWLDLTAIENIPASTPVILKGTYYNKFAKDVPAINISNDLKGTADATEADGTMYVLAKPEDKEVGFYQAIEGTTIPAGKAYYQATTNLSVKAFFFSGEDATAIDNVNANVNANNAAIYNIAGQRINKLQKGINIVNGKKVLF